MQAAQQQRRAPAGQVRCVYYYGTAEEISFLPPSSGGGRPRRSSCSDSSSAACLAKLGRCEPEIETGIAALVNAAQVSGSYLEPAAASREMSWRESSLKAAIRLLPTGGDAGEPPYLGASSTYAGLPSPAESGLSFHMGEVFAALLADRVAADSGNFANFMAYERWQELARFVPLERRYSQAPCFVSQIRDGAFQAWSSAGRDGPDTPTPALRATMASSWALRKVGGSKPDAYVGVVAAVDPPRRQRPPGPGGPADGRWRIYAVDPPGADCPPPTEAEAQDAIFRQYYEPLLAIIGLGAATPQLQVRDVGVFRGVTRPSRDCWLGIDERIWSWFRSQQGRQPAPGSLSQRLGEILERRPRSRGGKLFVNRNGVLTTVGESWLRL